MANKLCKNRQENLMSISPENDKNFFFGLIFPFFFYLSTYYHEAVPIFRKIMISFWENPTTQGRANMIS